MSKRGLNASVNVAKYFSKFSFLLYIHFFFFWLRRQGGGFGVNEIEVVDKSIITPS